jgi:16S rRNA (adenine1518-N6/adenine1519-N6)-dimethyltransferase
MNATKIREILTELGIRPTKKLGQNFLIEPSIIKSQIEFANLTNRDTVLEIGAGLGNLTLELSAHARKVITIEKDKILGRYLKTIIPDNVELIIGDAMKLDFPKFDKIVANLPYKISSPLSFKLMDYEFESAVLMYQREFADRIVASPRTKKYGRLTVNLYYRFDSKILRKVARESFYPVPKVNSAIVELVPRATPFEVKDQDLFFKLVNVLFSQRRKKIKNSLKNKKKLFNFDEEKLQDFLSDFPFQDNRPEELAPEQLAELANMLADVV